MMTPLAAPPKRGRKKKTANETGATVETKIKTSPTSNGNAPQALTDPETRVPSAKLKQTRRVGEPKLKRYPVREQEINQDTKHVFLPDGAFPDWQQIQPHL